MSNPTKGCHILGRDVPSSRNSVTSNLGLYHVTDGLRQQIKEWTPLASKFDIGNIDIMVNGVLHGNNEAGKSQFIHLSEKYTLEPK